MLLVYSQDIFTLWLRMLPNLLKKPTIDVTVLKALLCLAKQNNAIFLKSLEENAEDIVKNLTSIAVSNEQHKHEGLLLIVNLIFWINRRETLVKLIDGELVKQMKLDDSIKTYFQSTLRARLQYL